MSFQTRLLLMNYVLIILLVSILGTVFYRHSATILEDNAKANIEIISQKMSQQLDDLIRQMDFASLYTASNQSFMTSVNVLSTIDRQSANSFQYITQSSMTISGILRSYAIGAKFYRINMFNNKGDFQTSYFISPTAPNIAEIENSLTWLKAAREQDGKFIIIPPHDDPWVTKNPARVFGLGRALQGGKSGLGYLEVQNEYSRLESLFSLSGLSDTEVIAITNQGEIFYNSLEQKTPLIFLEEIEKDSNYNIADIVSDYTGMHIYIIQSKNALLQPLSVTRSLTVSVGIIIAVLSIGIVSVLSRRMTKPLRNLMTKMEQTSVENLSDAIEITRGNDEIAALETVFAQMRERLMDAIAKETESQRLQMQANFDSLQAQVNPHFIYNILTVLSSRGLTSGNLEICEICESISAMLRYSTSTTERYTTIYDEIMHARTYLQLQKKRFEHKLNYRICEDEAISSQRIPKIVVQQLVENAIIHGFKDVSQVMEIEIVGELREDRWYITVYDNGQGFSNEALQRLLDEVDHLRHNRNELSMSLGIGGLGLLNTCARLSLYYDGQFTFEAGQENGRTRVCIGGIMKGEAYENTIG